MQVTRGGNEGREGLLLPHGVTSIGEIRKIWESIVVISHNTVGLVHTTDLRC